MIIRYDLDKENLDTKTRIMEYAIELFVTNGLQQTSMALLSKVSGIAIGTIYHYFEGKTTLIEESYIYVSKLFGLSAKPSEDDYKLPYKEQFRLMWTKSCLFFMENPNYFFFKDSLQYSPLISDELRISTQEHYIHAFNLIKKGIEQNLFDQNDPEIIGAWIYNTLMTPVQLKIGGNQTINDSRLNDLFEMTWKGIVKNENIPA